MFSAIGTLISAEETAVLNSTKNEVLIIDELQEISLRHLGRLEILLVKQNM